VDAVVGPLLLCVCYYLWYFNFQYFHSLWRWWV